MRKQLAAAAASVRQRGTTAGRNRDLQTAAVPENPQRARMRSAAQRCPGHRKTSPATANGIRRADTSAAKRAKHAGTVWQIRLQPRAVDRELFRFAARRLDRSRCRRVETEECRSAPVERPDSFEARAGVWDCE